MFPEAVKGKHLGFQRCWQGVDWCGRVPGKVCWCMNGTLGPRQQVQGDQVLTDLIGPTV